MTDDTPFSDSARGIERFVDNLPGIAYRCRPDPPREMEFVGGRVRSTTGYSATAFESDELAYGDIVLDDDREALEREIRSGVESRSQFSATYRIRTRGGDVRHVFERGAPVAEGDEVVALEGIIVDVTERKETERRLRRQNELFTNTQQLADVGGWELDVADEELRWTEQVKRIHGVELESTPSLEAAVEFYHPDDRAEIRTAVERAIEDGVPFDRTLRILTDEGERRWVRARGTPETRDGEVVHVSGAVQDVTAPKRRERALREERILTRSIFEALPDLLYAFDEDGEFMRWNEEVSTVTGYTDEEIATMRAPEFVAAEDRPRVRDHIDTVIQSGETTTLEAQLRTKEGDLIPYEFRAAQLLGEDGTSLGLVGIGRDISGQKQRDRRFEAVFNNTYQFTGLLEPDGTVLEVNEAALSFGNYDRTEVVGQKIWTAFPFGDDETRTTVRRGVERARDGEFFRDEIHVRRDRTDTAVDFSVRPITDESGGVTLLVAEGRDISKLKRREELLRLLHRLLRHNLRNDLNVIKGYTGTLREELSDPTLAEYAERIETAAGDLLHKSETAKELLDISLQQSDGTEPVDLGDRLEAIGASLAERNPDADVAVTVDGPAVVEGDSRLDALFAQLLENAIEHSDRDVPRVQVTVREREGNVRVEIADNGPGIPSEEWSVAVEEGETDSTQLRHGSGVGLLLATWVVDDYGGRLEYDDEGDDDGAIVAVELPCR
ncbi:PAS domain-containing sensor histidine kinase [Natronoarchaeum rubrum]|uniref:PAS domain-containing sensor histidine kinase n=1 Tax=Natronoarchaeum rubrum TaxID=755311 RepID=UPI00211341E7|nr:PAS domain S-box protein [Natronoarchaeum rubrum]